MKHLFAAALLGVTLALAPPLPTTSQAFGDRAANLSSRIAAAQNAGRLLPGQQTLLQTQLDVAQRANAAHDPNAAGMLDAIDRQMAQVDYALSRAEDGLAISVPVGSRVSVAMHDEYVYDLHLSDTNAIAPMVGIMWARGIQGIYTTRTPGTVTITLEPRAGASPAPPANLAKPVQFYVVVTPAQR